MVRNFPLVSVPVLPAEEPVLADGTGETRPSGGRRPRREAGRAQGAVLGVQTLCGQGLGHARTHAPCHRRGRLIPVDLSADVTHAASLTRGLWRQAKPASRSRSRLEGKILAVQR